MYEQQLDYAIRRLSEESMSVSEINSAFSKAVPRIYDYISEVKSDMDKSFEQIADSVKNNLAMSVKLNWDNNPEAYKSGYDWEMTDAIENSEYLNMGTHGHYLVNVPENFEGNLLDYGSKLITSIEDTRHLYLDIQGRYVSILKAFISNKADRLSLKDHSSLFKELGEKQVEISKRTNRFFPDHTGKTKRQLSTVLTRASDLEALFDCLVKLKSINDRKNMHLVEDKVAEVRDLLEHILDEIKKGKITDVTQAVSLNIANGAKSMGDLTKFYVALTYDVDTFIQSVHSLASTINLAFER